MLISFAKLFRLLSRAQLIPPPGEIEEFQVEHQPWIMGSGGAPRKNAPAIRALGFIHSHNSLCYDLSLRAAESGCDEAVVRFAHTAAEGDRGASFEVYERNSTRSGGGQIFTAKSCSPRPTRWLISRDAIA